MSSNSIKTTVRLTESAIMLAVAFLLSLIPFIAMPFGGSITLFSMVPILLVAYRHGIKWGLITAAAGALLQMAMGLNNFSYATSALAVVMIFLFDYFLAFGCLGLGGIFRGKCRNNQALELALGALLCCAIRYACHLVSGYVVWRDISIPATDALIYDIAYNAAYMVPETILTVAGALALGSALDFRGESLKRLAGQRGGIGAILAFVVLILAIAAAAVCLFMAIQTEEGFDITAIGSANWYVVIPLLAVAFIAGAAAALLSLKKTKE
ncbi:MAG: energy-coupled thiamine transporter ThiT [Clostridia bacterium]|nr:energy-coupled thiamine transporter ThiT [Clostridia bacterium]